jgi:hypothetical protein
VEEIGCWRIHAGSINHQLPRVRSCAFLVSHAKSNGNAILRG